MKKNNFQKENYFTRTYEVLGKLEINKKDVIHNIHLDLQHRVESTRGYTYTYYFDPRHGIRAYKGDEFIDYSICFHCHHLYVYRTKEGDHERIGLEGPQVNQLLNSILDKAGIERDQPPIE